MKVTFGTGTRRTSSRAPRWIVWVFPLVGLGLLAGAGLAVWMELSFRQRAVEAEGRIVQMIPRSSTDSDGHRSTTWTPVFVFRLPDGKEMRVVAGYSSSPPCCTVGEVIRVRYDPADPSRAQMAGFLASWLVATILGGIGLVFLLAGLLAARLMRRLGGAVAMAVPAGAVPMAMPAGGDAPPGMMTFPVPLAGLRRAGTAYVLQARWTDPRSGVQRLFESVPIPFDPVPQMRHMTSVPIAFDPGDPASPYRMDLSFLRDPGPGGAAAPPASAVRRG